MSQPGHPTYIPVANPGMEVITPAQLDHARHVVAGHAHDTDDARVLLGTLGLVDECAERAAVVRGDG